MWPSQNIWNLKKDLIPKFCSFLGIYELWYGKYKVHMYMYSEKTTKFEKNP